MPQDIQGLDEYIATPATRLSNPFANPSWMKMLLVALVYFACAYFSRLVNLPDYYNLFTGLPAGLAFVTFVIWGPRLWQFIWISAFAADLLHYVNQVHDAESIAINIITAFFTASGAITQALIGAYLAKPFVKNANKILNIVETTVFLCRAGPIACLISTTINTFVLYQFHGLQDNAIIMITWMSGYTLDILGILLLAPVIFYTQSYMRIGNGWRRRIVIVTTSLFGTAALLLAGLCLFNHNEARNSRIIFEEKANEINFHARNAIRIGEDRLRNIAALSKSNNSLTSSEFVIFNQTAGLPECVITFSWIPNEAYGVTAGTFTHRLIYPEDHEADLYGKDIAEQVSGPALQRTMKTGRLTLASSVDSNKPVWWLIYPVFADISLDTKSTPDSKLLGFAAAQINMQLFFEDLVNTADHMNIALRIKGMASWHPSETLLEHRVPAQSAPDLKYSLSKHFAGEGLQIEMWSLHVPEFGWEIGSIIFLLFGLIFMILISAYSFNTLNYGFYLEHQITKRTREIELQNARTNALVENLKDVAFTVDENGIVQSINPAITHIFGYTVTEVIGSSITFLIPEMVCSLTNCWLQTKEAKSFELEKETEAQHKNGHFFPIRLTIAEYSVDGERFFSGVLHDLREQKRLMSDVEAARDKAEAASHAKSDFLAAMSHEIRTPMNGVIGMLEVLTQSSLRPDQVEIVELVRESAIALLGIINDILDFSKIEAGKLQLADEPLSIEKETEKVCALLDRMAEQKNVELLMFVDPAIPGRLQGDALRLRQILYNLINNAIKFSSKLKRQGYVSVHVKLASPEQGQTWIQCEVCDNGIGMSEEVQLRLFTAFEQGESSTTRRFGGTGLGLAISRQLANMMGGEITVQSTINEGSIFFVRLPFTHRSADKQNESMPLAELSCLTIGSEGGFISNATRYLTHAGAQVQHVESINDVNVHGTTSSGKPWVWLLDTKVNFSTDLLRTITNQYAQQNIRIIVIGRGRRRKPRCIGDNIFLVDANVLSRRNLIHTVALAAGFAQEEELASSNESYATITETTVSENNLCLGNPILVAEDNEINQKVIQRQLTLLGIKADIANNGREALRLWMTNKYALLLTDVHMPDIDGYQLTAAIRAEETKANLNRMPIIALTANVLKGEAEHCKALGMDDYLSKPVQLAVLKETIEKWYSLTEIKDNAYPEVAPMDVNILKKLVGNDETVIDEMLSAFRTSATRIESELQIACEALLCDRAKKAAHKLKSSARSVGALRLGDVCEQIEQAGKNGEAEILGDLFARFELEMASVNSYLVKSIKSNEQ
ncbi:ATP-binding protein [Nitrosomonas aestuarii]|uniref:ATP-binding protein n=1 Tax=Nitrosomonas aestuarii TaxID=52441 RepID=UPI000D319450|nr:ATP-binding protein [Nitrosomonas aestuarii]PTN12264.1 PAS domain S-box-containing protein [Nitrosomonas aestuarii]